MIGVVKPINSARWQQQSSNQRFHLFMNRIRHWRSKMTFFPTQNLLLFEFIANCGGCEYFVSPLLWFFFPEDIYFSSIMSWLKAASTYGDDVFDENADDMSVISNEWVSNMKKRLRVNAACSVC